MTFCSLPETASDFICGKFVRPIVLDKCVKCGDPCLNRSPEIPPEAVGGGIFGRFPNFNECRPEAAGDVTSGVPLTYVGKDVAGSFGESKLNNGRGPDPFWHFSAEFNDILQPTGNS